MNQKTLADLLLMVLDLRLAGRGPAERLAQRLPAERLHEIADMLEAIVDRDGPIETAEARPANDSRPGPAHRTRTA
ncbi:hypothetical protein [Aurantimonas sp. Leaf443]|uniref:hypothetical protein n=1 Tax=Aurantimonas sp. Leaf443 TaxID=1736378 RepID=UPI0006FB2660|nr:hypothetical protein [Aurantimonas sp. Leaf443]KQT83816.1 hypothetical protein ASG48_10450 [Aurantimonas sp. Leaf443]